eukprot:NODE_31_length_32452_cov_0.352672.p10 type:complete len:324 gc:universal NODE_31_length_32452_cov_0.352672:9152-10123(+)
MEELSPFHHLLQQQTTGKASNDKIINLKAKYSSSLASNESSIAVLKNRKVKVIKKNENAKVCLVKKDGASLLFSNIVDEYPKGAEVMQVEECPSLPTRPLLPSTSQIRLDRGIEFLYTSFGSHLPSKDSSTAVLGERETMLFNKRLERKKWKLKQLEYVDGMDIDENIYNFVQKQGDAKLLKKIKNNPKSIEALQVKIEFLLKWMQCIARLKDDLDAETPTEKILDAIYRKSLVAHITACSKANKTSKYLYKHPKKDIRAMMDRLILKIPPFQGNLSTDKPFSFTCNMEDSIPKNANIGSEYPLEPEDVENYYILKDIAAPAE